MFYDTTWYCNFGNGSSTGYYAVTVRPQNTAVVAGVIRRQFTAPSVGNERCFVCIVAGTTANTTDATWTLGNGTKTTDGTATWQEVTGKSAVNGDATNTPSWTVAKAAGTPTLGAIIKRNSGASYQICTTAGTMAASEPSFSDTAGVTTNDGTSVWTCIGLVGAFTGGGAPLARLATAAAYAAAYLTIYVGHNHAESQATTIAIGLAGGSSSTFSRVMCHNSAGAYPPASGDLTTGAVISTTASVGISLAPGLAGNFYYRGLTFRSGVGATGTATVSSVAGSSFTYFDNCSFELATTGASSLISFGSGTTPSFIMLNNCTVKFAAVAQSVSIFAAQFLWQNTGTVLVSGSVVPTDFIKTPASNADFIVLEALDLSQLTGNLSGVTTSSMGHFTIRDCKLHASATVTTPTNFAHYVQLARSSA